MSRIGLGFRGNVGLANRKALHTAVWSGSRVASSSTCIDLRQNYDVLLDIVVIFCAGPISDRDLRPQDCLGSDTPLICSCFPKPVAGFVSETWGGGQLKTCSQLHPRTGLRWPSESTGGEGEHPSPSAHEQASLVVEIVGPRWSAVLQVSGTEL